MAMTLAEYKKTTREPLRAGVIQTFMDNAPVLNYLSFTNIVGSVYSYNAEGTLPDTDFRAINTPFATSSGVVNTSTEEIKIGGGKITIDRALRDMYGDDRLKTDMEMKVKSMARTVSLAFFKGDTGSNALEFDGLQTRISGDQQLVQGDTALSLGKLREAVVKTKGSNKVIFVGQEMYLRLSDALNDPALSNQLSQATDQFGAPIFYFAGIPVVMAGEATDGSQILDFTEANTTTSIYVCAFESNGVTGIQAKPLQAFEPVKESVGTEFDIEWILSYYIANPDSAYQISGITNVPVVK